MFWPVSQRASSLTTKATTSAMSLGVPSRLSGEACSPVWRKVGSAGIMAVSVNPGETVFTVIPLGASSCARPFVNCSRAPLLPRYSGTGKADMGAVRGNVHDASPFLDDFRRFLQRKIGALGIEGKHAVELFLGRLDQGLVHEYPGVVHQYVQPTEFRHRVLDQPAYIGDLTHIGLDRD